MVGHATALLILATAVSYWQVILGLVIQGISWGVRSPVVNAMRGDYFGRKHFPVIMGFTKFIMMFGMMFGTFFPGFMDDQFSYRAAFLTLSATSSLGVILFLLMPFYLGFIGVNINEGVVKEDDVFSLEDDKNMTISLQSAKKFFPDREKAEHLGSMYTIRTVLPYKDDTDERPTIVEKQDNSFILFSGKIGNCVQASDRIIKMIK